MAGVKALLARFRAAECPRSVEDSSGLTALVHSPAVNGREAHISGQSPEMTCKTRRIRELSPGAVPSLVARGFRTSNRDREIRVVVATILRVGRYAHWSER